MSATLWLRIAAVLAGLYALGHTAGMPWTTSRDVMAQGVVVAMQGVHFAAAGSVRSYWEFYQGFGLAISVLLALEALLLWQLASLARSTLRFRAMAWAHLVGFVCLALIAYRYLFAVPVWLAVAIAGCVGAALAWPAVRLTASAGQ